MIAKKTSRKAASAKSKSDRESTVPTKPRDPKASAEPTITTVFFAAFVNGPTDSVLAMSALLRGLADDPLLAPTHADPDDRKRTPFDLERLANLAAEMRSPFVWRTRRPKYMGLVEATPQLLGRLSLDFEDIDGDDIEQVCDALGRATARIQPFYAALHFKWGDGKGDDVPSGQGLHEKSTTLRKYGPPGVFEWTWFGPELTASLGLGTLLELGATPTPGGGSSLPLAPRPWTVSPPELRARQLQIDATLRKKGWFGDYTKFPPIVGQPNEVKAPNWTPMPALKKATS